ncbi:MAG: hypothetical protein AAF624_12490 [Bacteroidota bacterium]
MSSLLRRLFLVSLVLTFGSLVLMLLDIVLGVQVPVVRRYLPYGLAVGMIVLLTVYVGHVGKPDDPSKRMERQDQEEGDHTAPDTLEPPRES